MKVLKTFTRLMNTTYKSYSLLIDKLFYLLFGTGSHNNARLVYCKANYLVTSGGAVVCLDE